MRYREISDDVEADLVTVDLYLLSCSWPDPSSSPYTESNITPTNFWTWSTNFSPLIRRWTGGARWKVSRLFENLSYRYENRFPACQYNSLRTESLKSDDVHQGGIASGLIGIWPPTRPNGFWWSIFQRETSTPFISSNTGVNDGAYIVWCMSCRRVINQYKRYSDHINRECVRKYH